MKCPEKLLTTQMIITIFESMYCLLSFPIKMFCTPFANWSGSFQLAENMWCVQSFLCCMTTLSISVASNQLLAHFHPEIQEVISCFQSNVFIRCSVQNFKGIYKTHFHNKVKEKLPVFLDGLPTGFLARCCIHLSTPLMYFW